MFVLRRVINTNAGTLKTTKDFQEQVLKHIKLWPFLIKGFTAARLERIFKHIFTILIWKERHHPPTWGWFILTITQAFMNLFGETLWLYGWVFTPLRCFRSAYVSACRCHAQASPTKWSQLIALDFLPETAEPKPGVSPRWAQWVKFLCSWQRSEKMPRDI